MTAFKFIAAFFEIVIWMGALAQLLGMPVAWLRLRNTPAWKNRPAGVRRIDLLARFIIRATASAIVWGWVMLVVIVLGGLGFSGMALLVLTWGAPVIFVPWIVLQLDESRFPGMVEEARLEHERKLAPRR